MGGFLARPLPFYPPMVTDHATRRPPHPHLGASSPFAAELRSAGRVVVIVTAFLFAAEFLVMLLLAWLGPLAPGLGALTDGLLVLAVTAPVLYLAWLQPWRRRQIGSDGIDSEVVCGPAPLRGLDSPKRLVLVVAASIFVAEGLIMLLMASLAPLSGSIEALLDSSLLVLVVTPILYFAQLRPLRRQAAERDAAFRALREAQVDLELRIAERTAELAAINDRLGASVQDLERMNREVTVLGEMAALFQACRSAEEVYGVIAESAQQLLPDLGGKLYVLRASHDQLELASSWGDGPAGPDMFPPDDCWALRRGRPHSAAPHDSAIACRHYGDYGERAGRQLVCLPIAAHGETLGLLVLQAHLEPGTQISTSHEGIARSTAEHIGLALAALRLREKLRQQAIRDPLTGLFNRRYLEEPLERELERAVRRNSEVAVLMLDVDHFKAFNDSHGHQAGDVLLRELGALLRANVRGEDIPCRFGGEEFALILPDASLESAAQRAESLRIAVRAMAVPWQGSTLGPVSISVGVAAYPDHGAQGAAVLGAADRALYSAKRSGRDRVELAAPTIENRPNESRAADPLPKIRLALRARP